MSFSQVLKSISGIFGLIPGLAILMTNLGVPPGQSKLLFGGIVEVFGALTLLLLFLNRDRIKDSKRNITAISIFCGVASLVGIFLYFFLSESTIVQSGNFRPILSPLWFEGDLATKLTTSGIEDLIQEYGPTKVEMWIKEMPGFSLLVTNVLYVLGQLFIFIPLIIAFGIPGIKLSNTQP